MLEGAIGAILVLVLNARSPAHPGTAWGSTSWPGLKWGIEWLEGGSREDQGRQEGCSMQGSKTQPVGFEPGILACDSGVLRLSYPAY